MNAFIPQLFLCVGFFESPDQKKRSDLKVDRKTKASIVYLLKRRMHTNEIKKGRPKTILLGHTDGNGLVSAYCNKPKLVKMSCAGRVMLDLNCRSVQILKSSVEMSWAQLKMSGQRSWSWEKTD